MFNNEDHLPSFSPDFWSSINSPPASVQSPVCEFTFDDTQHFEQPYPSPAESDSQYDPEQSFDFNPILAQPIPNSQDYNDSYTLSDEIDGLQLLSGDYVLPIPMIETIKKEYEPDEKDVLMRDIMFCGRQQIPFTYTYTESQDLNIIVKPAEISLQFTNTEPKQIEEPEETETESVERFKHQVDVEHNYSEAQIANNNGYSNLNTTDNNDAPAEIQMSPRKLSHRRRLPPLKLQISNTLMNHDEDAAANTAEIISSTLDMENEKFDLIKFIDAPEEEQQEERKMPDVAQITNRKRSAIQIEDIEAMIPTPSATPMKRSRQNSAQSNDSFSTTSSTIFSPKRRGRPPKTEATPISPSVYKHLNENDRKYLEMRNKNNEASRRSRQNRRGKETHVMTEAMKLEQRNKELTSTFEKLDKLRHIWRRAVIRLAKI